MTVDPFVRVNHCTKIGNHLAKGSSDTEWILSNPLRRNGTPPLFDVLPFEINNENYFSLIGIICTLFGNFPHSSVG